MPKRRAFNSTLPSPTKPMARSQFKRKGATCVTGLRKRAVKSEAARMREKHKQSKRRQGIVYGPYHWWIGRQRCLVSGKHVCSGKVRGHHVKHVSNGGMDFGNEVPLCDGAHTMGPNAIHTIGKGSFNALYGVDVTLEARRFEGRWLADLAATNAKPDIA